MLFNTQGYLVFFLLVVLMYFILPKAWRWVLLLIGSYFFYMNWNAYYAILMMVSTGITYASGLLLSNTDSKGRKKLILAISLISNLGILFVFKYYGFFRENMEALAELLKVGNAFPELNILLPVGISFYTFQALSYSLDVYYDKIKPERHFGIYALYVSFFPQLVAGPIERSTNLIPQLEKSKDFDYSNFRRGLALIAFGLFKKMVIADRLSVLVNTIYNDPESFTGVSLYIATLFFAFQIYCDFSGYSDIAIGSARVLGIDLMKNFDRPYFAKSIGEFWQRWHISLSTWFRDYLYIPLGGNRAGRFRVFINLMITFLVSGLWHGASWNFVIWGGLHGFYLIIERLLKVNKVNTRVLSFGAKMPRVLLTFALTCFAWIFFRANTLSDSYYIISHLHLKNIRILFDGSLYTYGLNAQEFWVASISIIVLLVIHFIQRRKHLAEWLFLQPWYFRWPVYTLVAMVVIFFGVYGNFQPSQFIYFQF